MPPPNKFILAKYVCTGKCRDHDLLKGIGGASMISTVTVTQ